MRPAVGSSVDVKALALPPPNSKRALIVLNREHPDADYAALPSGARFLGPDGVNRRKP